MFPCTIIKPPRGCDENDGDGDGDDEGDGDDNDDGDDDGDDDNDNISETFEISLLTPFGFFRFEDSAATTSTVAWEYPKVRIVMVLRCCE